MNIHGKTFRKFLVFAASLPLLTSCAEAITFKAVTAGIAASAHGVFSRPDVNLKEKNYAAADYLVQQMRVNITYNDLIFAKPLEEEDYPGISSPLGENVAEGVGLRLMELGYNISLHDTVSEGMTNPYPLPPSGKSPDYVLKGTYLRQRDRIDVKLRLVDLKSGRIAASFDYPLLLSAEIRNLAKTQPKIYRLPQ